MSTATAEITSESRPPPQPTSSTLSPASGSTFRLSNLCPESDRHCCFRTRDIWCVVPKTKIMQWTWARTSSGHRSFDASDMVHCQMRRLKGCTVAQRLHRSTAGSKDLSRGRRGLDGRS
jgi:hypothetical protein